MDFRSDQFLLTLLDEPTYFQKSTDSLRVYGNEYSFCGEYSPVSKYGAFCKGSDSIHHSCILLAARGATRVNAYSAVIVGNRAFVAICDTICLLSLPTLDLLWGKKVDSATCFGVYYSFDHDCLVSHGELEIARVKLSGEIIWSSGGKDIFTEGFRLNSDHVEAIDFYHNLYRFKLSTGKALP